MSVVSMCPAADQVMVTNVTSLLKTVKTVEDEAARGTQALESSIEAISQEMRVIIHVWFLPVRCVSIASYASAGIAREGMSVCLSHSDIVSKRRKLAS